MNYPELDHITGRRFRYVTRVIGGHEVRVREFEPGASLNKPKPRSKYDQAKWFEHERDEKRGIYYPHTNRQI